LIVVLYRNCVSQLLCEIFMLAAGFTNILVSKEVGTRAHPPRACVEKVEEEGTRYTS
jgi:hypothetical protein